MCVPFHLVITYSRCLPWCSSTTLHTGFI